LLNKDSINSKAAFVRRKTVHFYLFAFQRIFFIFVALYHNSKISREISATSPNHVDRVTADDIIKHIF